MRVAPVGAASGSAEVAGKSEYMSMSRRRPPMCMKERNRPSRAKPDGLGDAQGRARSPVRSRARSASRRGRRRRSRRAAERPARGSAPALWTRRPSSRPSSARSPDRGCAGRPLPAGEHRRRRRSASAGRCRCAGPCSPCAATAGPPPRRTARGPGCSGGWPDPAPRPRSPGCRLSAIRRRVTTPSVRPSTGNSIGRGLIAPRRRGRRPRCARLRPGRPGSGGVPTSSTSVAAAPGPPRRRAASPARPAQLGDVRAKRLGVRGREDDEARPETFGGRRRRVDRRVLAEVGDPPAAVAQREAESDQPEVVLLARRAGEHRDRAVAPAPAAGEGEQPPAHEVGGEVLLADADLLALPPIADVPHRRERDVAEHRVERERGDRAVEDGVGARLVERGERLGELGRPGGEDPRLVRRAPAPILGRRARPAPPRRPTSRPRSARSPRSRAARPRSSRAGSRPASARARAARSGAPRPAACRRRPRFASKAHRSAGAPLDVGTPELMSEAGPTLDRVHANRLSSPSQS